MRKNFFLLGAVCAVGAMSSCSVDKVVDQAEARYIGFDPFANKVARAVTTAEGLGHSNFSAFGRYEDATSDYKVVFNNRKVEWKGTGTSDTNGSWEYENPVPWVNGKTYEFAAIAPVQPADVTYDYHYSTNLMSGSTPLNGTYSITGIEITQDKQIDYLTATPVKVECNTAFTNPVSFIFNHILSKIDFNFQPKIANDNAWPSPVKMDIKQITLAGVHTKNTYTTNNWTGSSVPNSFMKKGENAINNGVYGTTEYNGTKVTALTNQFSWLVIPQNNNDASARKLTIKFDVYTQDAAGAYKVKVLTDKEATVNIVDNWDANTHYTYTVYIGTDILGQNPYITFDVEKVEGWTKRQSNDVDVTSLNP